MTLIDVRFSGNEAKTAGGALFAGYLEAIRFRCSDAASAVAALMFNDESKGKALSRLASLGDICPFWKHNRANDYGPDVGTYAVRALMSVKDAKKPAVCASGEDCVVDEYRAAADMPEARLELLDGLGQGPARNYRPVMANLSSPGGEFLIGSIILPMEQGNCTFRSIKGFAPPGEYRLIIEFGEEAIGGIGITVRVRNCSIGESLSSAESCVDCSSTTYNFFPSRGVCQSCPENGNCTSRVITPNDGYWQKTPCSARLYRCLPTSACKFEGRSEKLARAVDNFTKCDFEQEWIEENYTRVQCAKVIATFLFTYLQDICA